MSPPLEPSVTADESGEPLKEPVQHVESSMNTIDRSRVIPLAKAQLGIPGAAGEHSVVVLQHGTLDVKLSLPERPNQQTPHAQDEVYVIIRGRGVFLHDGARDPFESGDLVFVAAVP